MAESPDPRVGGTKIIFDSRLSEISETSQLDAFIKVKQQEKQKKLKHPNDIEKQKLMLQ